jgi:hypothetical protein
MLVGCRQLVTKRLQRQMPPLLLLLRLLSVLLLRLLPVLLLLPLLLLPLPLPLLLLHQQLLAGRSERALPIRGTGLTLLSALLACWRGPQLLAMGYLMRSAPSLERRPMNCGHCSKPTESYSTSESNKRRTSLVSPSTSTQSILACNALVALRWLGRRQKLLDCVG